MSLVRGQYKLMIFFSVCVLFEFRVWVLAF